jgi:short-subunit dehydrogenase
LPPVTAEKVAKRIARAVERNQRSVYISWFPDRAAVALNWLAPWAITAVLRRWARRAQGP